MAQLTRAHQQLYERSPDERFSSLQDLWGHCQQEKQFSNDRWHLPLSLQPRAAEGSVTVTLGDDGAFVLNDWSFTQLCHLSGINKKTVNRLSPETASRALQETLPHAEKPIQMLTTAKSVRSLHGVSYTRLWNADLLSVVSEFATDFQPPPAGVGGGTGLYCGEQDMFVFLIDPTGWAEINGEAFAPGFFLWNSEVGRRSLGIQSFWFEAVCHNHIVWDAVEVVDFTRKHTANVHEGLDEIRRIIEALVAKRDARRDGFVRLLTKAMQQSLGPDADSVAKELIRNGIPRNLASNAIEIARQQGAFTIFTLVDALTRLTQNLKYAGDRVESDTKVASLLSLVV
jgi:hypothetical protein